MPIKRCKENGKSGWKYGDEGKCYTGPGAKKKAVRQGIAIDGPNFHGSSRVQEIVEGVTSRLAEEKEVDK